ncbi:MAG: MBL fold metallo-hydrolase [Lachnospiraceae bacterium]|nr:MBL fold metallo-hydrolase [Lachnospiraceae bacterium]
MRMCSLGSGSSGNCIYAGTSTANILIDTGLSCKKTVERLNDIGTDISEIDAIFLTHEHSDHISGLRVISKKYNIPIYSTYGTIEAVKRTPNACEIDETLYHCVEPDVAFEIKGVKAVPVRIDHDAADPVAYRLEADGKRGGVITDLGTFSEYTVQAMSGLQTIFIEANHDLRMLECGRYPYPLKQRIMGDHGHLSNDDSARLLSYLLNDDIERVMLAHLSRENNLPVIAYESVRSGISLSDTKYEGDDFPINVCPRDEISKIVEW